MAHQSMFNDDDPVLARVREIAFSFPGAGEKVSHGRPTFFTRKVFAYYGMSARVRDAWVQHPQSVCLLLPEEERLALRELPHCWWPSYIGPSGWLGFDLGAATDWDEIRELFDDSYRMTAPPGLIRELDTRTHRQGHTCQEPVT